DHGVKAVAPVDAVVDPTGHRSATRPAELNAL
ncbi:MAG: hypothetical protein RLZZ191_663, partial [Pseudomonadota bacterium]